MSKIDFWKNVFLQKEKVAVDVGQKTELLTHTQSFRFRQIAENRDAPRHAGYHNPLENEHYRLEDAARRLMISEDDVLAKGTAGDIRLYVDVTAANLPAWGPGDKRFFPLHPMTVEPEMVVLLPAY